MSLNPPPFDDARPYANTHQYIGNLLHVVQLIVAAHMRPYAARLVDQTGQYNDNRIMMSMALRARSHLSHPYEIKRLCSATLTFLDHHIDATHLQHWLRLCVRYRPSPLHYRPRPTG